MSKKTNIAWCDSTINFWSGCTKVSEGCKHCYAEARDARMLIEKIIHWGKGAPRLKTKGAIKTALALNRKPWICDKCGKVNPQDTFCWTDGCDGSSFHRRRIFSLSLGDFLDAEVPIEWLAEMLDTIRQCDQVTWILCTKRPQLFKTRLHAVNLNEPEIGFNGPLVEFVSSWIDGHAPKNIIVLTSVENQATADQRIPELLKIPAACRGLSVEPMLGPVDFLNILGRDGVNELTHGLPGDHKIDWVIFGGESGPGARPCNVDWIRDGVKQCQAAGVAPFVKQLGAFPEGFWIDGAEIPLPPACWRLRIRDKKGGDLAEWPEDFRVREFPTTK